VFDYTAWAVLLQTTSLAVPPGVYLHKGNRAGTERFLHALCPALGLGLRVFWIDGGNAFDANGAAYKARQLGHDPRLVLGRVRLARAFNAFQAETMVCKSLPKLWRGEPVVLSDPFSLFYDDGLPWTQAKAVFARMLEGMRRLPAVWLVLSSGEKPPEGREGLVEAVEAA
jgi:hypothetical protein